MTIGTLGTTVRTARVAAGISLRSMAEEIGISPAYLSRVETETIQGTPSEQIVYAFASVLKMDSDELMRLGGRIPKDVQNYILENPSVLKRLRKGMGKAKKAKR